MTLLVDIPKQNLINAGVLMGGCDSGGRAGYLPPTGLAGQSPAP